MSSAQFEVGADVFPLGNGFRGEVIERRQLEDGQWLYGIVDANGGVAYYVERGLQSAAGMR